MIILSGKVIINGNELEVGGAVMNVNESCDYFGLKGVINEIRTGEDKETENPHDEVIVEYEVPEDSESIRELEERFSELYREPKSIDDIILDYVIMDASSLMIYNNETKTYLDKKDGTSNNYDFKHKIIVEC